MLSGHGPRQAGPLHRNPLEEATINVREAAETFRKASRLMRDAERDRNEAKDVLIDHFRTAKRSSLHGVAYSKSQYRQLDSKLARVLLGDQAEQAEVVRTRETITAVD